MRTLKNNQAFITRMGIYIRVKPKNVQPSQNFLTEKTIGYILACMLAGETNKLPPTPLVRKNQTNDYIAIDGHNVLAACDLLDKEVEVYIASSKYDDLQETAQSTPDSVKKRNK